MKLKIFIAILTTIFFFSCGAPTPDNHVYSSDSTLVGWDHAKPVYEHSVLIKPTWGQSFHYAKQGGWGGWLAFAIILFIAFCISAVLAATDNLPKFFDNEILKAICLGILLVASFACFFVQPGSLKWNNDHWVPKAQYDQYMSAQGNITPIWDSLANGCHMPWGPDKGCKR